MNHFAFSWSPIPNVNQTMLADMIGITRPRVNFFMTKFKKWGFLDYNGTLRVHSSLLNVVLHDYLSSRAEGVLMKLFGTGRDDKKKARPRLAVKIRWEALGLSNPDLVERATSIETIWKEMSSLASRPCGQGARSPRLQRRGATEYITTSLE